MELGIPVPQQGLLYIRVQPLPDGAGDGTGTGRGQNSTPLLIQQRQADGGGRKQTLILCIYRNQSSMEYRFKKQDR